MQRSFDKSESDTTAPPCGYIHYSLQGNARSIFVTGREFPQHEVQYKMHTHIQNNLQDETQVWFDKTCINAQACHVIMQPCGSTRYSSSTVWYLQYMFSDVKILSFKYSSQSRIE